MSYVSLNKAAKLLLVSEATVLKWVEQKKLKVRKTPDERLLVLHASVTEFLNSSLDVIEEIVAGSRPAVPCWEYNADKDKIKDECLSCPVFQSRETKCYQVGAFLKESGRGATCCLTDCEDCSYYKYQRQMSEEGQVFSSSGNDPENSERQNSN